MTDKEQQQLSNYHPYYSRLNPVLKARFEKRLDAFRDTRKFMRNGGGTLPDEVVLMISATAIQVSFGLSRYLFPHFNTIIVYPDTYISPFINKKTKGEVNPKGALVLSWSDYLEGYKNYHDGYNVGLHEMAHMLFIENLVPNHDFQFLSKKYLKDWNSQALENQENVLQPGKRFLRKYASVDKHELFAVAIEAFFERPADFRNARPGMYRALCGLLKQDPRNESRPLIPMNNK